MLKPMIYAALRVEGVPAAFGRLCVETLYGELCVTDFIQPPSGGCVLKPDGATIAPELTVQPPSGGCVLKPVCG